MLMSGCNKTSGQDTSSAPVDSVVQTESAQNQNYSTASMVTVGGETVSIDGVNGFADPSLGFGLVQDLLYKIPVPKLKVPKKVDKPLRYLKYAVLLVLVILLPAFLTNEFGIGQPYFCKWLCPAGTLEGGLPLLAANESLRQAAGSLFDWKLAVLIVIVLASMFIYRPFCKYLCPLGAFYGLFNKISFFRMNVDKEKCTLCGACEKGCKMGVEIRKNINSAECIRCGECGGHCPQGAISRSIGGCDKRKGEKNDGRTFG